MTSIKFLNAPVSAGLNSGCCWYHNRMMPSTSVCIVLWVYIAQCSLYRTHPQASSGLSWPQYSSILSVWPCLCSQFSSSFIWTKVTSYTTHLLPLTHRSYGTTIEIIKEFSLLSNAPTWYSTGLWWRKTSGQPETNMFTAPKNVSLQLSSPSPMSLPPFSTLFEAVFADLCYFWRPTLPSCRSLLKLGQAIWIIVKYKTCTYILK